jgi:serine/threonine protein kinase
MAADEDEVDDYRNTLPENSVLEDYRIKRVLGAGGFGLTYLARDLRQEPGSPARDVAIKEYLPFEIATRMPDGIQVGILSEADRDDFLFGLEKFEREARTLARFKHPNIVEVRRFFRANGTAYIVMKYERGVDFESVIESPDVMYEEDLRAIIAPLLDGLEAVHSQGFLHRDIKPSNIYIRKDDLTPVLLDFGAARAALKSKSQKMTALVTPGYAPFEQYSSEGNNGPWSDIYGLGAVLYAAVTKERPREATERMAALVKGKPDPQIPAASRARSLFSDDLLSAIDWALKVQEQDRPQNVAEFRDALGF